jgi:hypothetical protein
VLAFLTRTSAALVASLALVLVACGGSDKADPTATTAAATSSGNASATSGDASAPTEDEIVRDTSQLSYRVVSEYAATNEAGEATTVHETRVSDTVNVRTDSIDTNDPTSTVTIIQDAGASYVCRSETMTCVKYPRADGDSMAGDLLAYDVAKLTEYMTSTGATVTHLDDSAISGTDSECYSAVSTESQSNWCFSKDLGILMRVEGEYEVKELVVGTTSVDTTLPDGYTVEEATG